uniref:VP3 n=1 Tax=Shelly beach virus TaxID=2485878 RepID=A0A3G3BTV4_9VIRU|nr:VP3 [Shelly beach virus]UJQ88207.1 VP3 [Shelly beach virus]
MEPHTQEILIQLNTINKKMNKLQQEMKEMKIESRQLPHLSNASLYPISQSNSHTFGRSSQNELENDFEEHAYEFRPSRLIVDQLSLLNESYSYSHDKVQLSYYHTNFLVVDATFANYDGIFLNSSLPSVLHKVVALPFLLTDEPIFDASFKSTTLIFDKSKWYENVNAYVITKDLMIQQVRGIGSQSFGTIDHVSYRSILSLEPITMSLFEFIQLGQVKGIPIMNIQCDSIALRKDSHDQTLIMLLLRALLYSKAKDYLLDTQSEMSQKDTQIELVRSVTRLEQSTVIIQGIKVPTDTYQLSVKEMGFARHDLGDDTFALSLRQFFQDNLTYLSGNKLDPQKVSHVLSQQYNDAKIDVEVAIVTPMSEKRRKVQAFGLLVTEMDMNEGQNVFYMTDQDPPDLKNFKDVLQKAQLFKPKYEHDFKIIEMLTANKIRLQHFDSEFQQIPGSSLYVKNLPMSIEITDLIVAAGFYTFPPGSISRYIDLFFTYPQMLPYSAELETSYKIGVKRLNTMNDYGQIRTTADVETIHDGKLTMVQLDIGDGLTVSALKVRIALEKNTEQILATRQHHYYNQYPKRINHIDGLELDGFMRQTTLIEYSWDFHTYSGQKWDRDVQMDAHFRGLEAAIIPILAVPDGFITWTQQYDLEYQETVNIIAALVYRSNVQEMEIHQIKKALSDLTTVVNHLVSSVNELEKAFTRLTQQLQKNSHVPWWKKLLQGVTMVAGLAGTLAFPFCLPLAIALIAGSTALQVGMMFADGDYLSGGVQLAGALIGLGTGYYSFRKASAASYPVANLEEARVIPPDETIPGINTRTTDGLWIEVKPLNIISNKMEDVGKFMIKNTKGLLRTLMKFDNAPVHARVRSQTTKVQNGKTIRTTIVSGVTDGMPYLSHINPRPGTYEMLERYEGEGFINGWTKENVPIGGGFEDLRKSVQGLLIEGVGTDGEFQTLMKSWSKLSPQERAISLNDAQDYIRKNQAVYTEMPHTRVPISFDESLVRNVSDVFAKHTGIYELTGLGAPSGPNNCQTYSKELRDFFAKGSLRSNKLNNTSFLNDLMDAFNDSTQFKHIYTPGFEKRPEIARAGIPVVLA